MRIETCTTIRSPVIIIPIGCEQPWEIPRLPRLTRRSMRSYNGVQLRPVGSNLRDVAPSFDDGKFLATTLNKQVREQNFEE